MSAHFYDRLLRTKAFKDVAGGKSLTNREKALVQAASAKAELELGSLRTDIVRTEGIVDLERERTRFALVLGRGGALLKSGVEFAFTPFGEMRNLIPADAGSTSEPVEKPEPTTAESEESETPISGPNSRLFMEGLPKPLQATLQFLSERLANLNPITTVILYFLIATGAVSYAENRYGVIEANYNHTLKELKRYKDAEGEYKTAKTQLVQLTTTKQQLERDKASAADRLASQEKTISGLRDEMRTGRDRYEIAISSQSSTHRDELASLKGNFDAASKQLLEQQETKIRTLEKEGRQLTQQVADLRVDVAALENQSSDGSRKEKRLLKQKRALEAEVKSKDKRLEELEDVETNLRSLAVFSADTLTAVKRYLLEGDVQYATRNRNDFREKYRLIYKRDADVFEGMGLRRF